MLPFDASSVSLKYLVHGAVAIVLSFLITADVFAQAQFYQGKTITIIQGGDPAASAI
jgi:hypothetical protein